MGATLSRTQVDSSQLPLLCNGSSRDTTWNLAAPITVGSGQQYDYTKFSTVIQLPQLFVSAAQEIGDYQGKANVSFSFLPENAAAPNWLNFTYYNAPYNATYPNRKIVVQVPSADDPTPLSIGPVTAGPSASDVHLRLVAVDLTASSTYFGPIKVICGVSQGSPEYILSTVAIE